MLAVISAFLIFASCPANCPPEACKPTEKLSSRDLRIRQIDADIAELKEMKRGYEAKALRAEDQAERMQFEDRFILETRRYYRIADANREKAQRIQEEIDKLEAEKARLQK